MVIDDINAKAGLLVLRVDLNLEDSETALGPASNHIVIGVPLGSPSRAECR